MHDITLLFFPTAHYRLAHEAVTAQQSNFYGCDLTELTLAGHNMHGFIVTNCRLRTELLLHVLGRSKRPLKALVRILPGEAVTHRMLLVIRSRCFLIGSGFEAWTHLLPCSFTPFLHRDWPDACSTCPNGQLQHVRPFLLHAICGLLQRTIELPSTPELKKNKSTPCAPVSHK